MLASRYSCPRCWRRALGIAIVPLIAALAAWYSWQTIEQSEPFKRETDQWERLAKDIQRVFPEVPRNSQVVIIGGPHTGPLIQFHVMPSIGHTTWDPTVRLYSVPPELGDAEIAKREPHWLIARYEGDDLVVVPP